MANASTEGISELLILRAIVKNDLIKMQLFVCVGLLSIVSFGADTQQDKEKKMTSLGASVYYKVHQGQISEEHIKQLYPLNKELLHEYPYLSAGTLEFYNEAWHSMLPPTITLVLAYDTDDKIVGALVAFSADGPYGCAHVINQHQNYRSGKSFYIALVMVTKPYQRRGIARKLLHLCEAAAYEQGYTDIYLLTVVRSKDHPLKPDNAFDPGVVWEHLGFRKTNLFEVYNWPTRCGIPGNEFAAPIDNMSQYWHKGLIR